MNALSTDLCLFKDVFHYNFLYSCLDESPQEKFRALFRHKNAPVSYIMNDSRSNGVLIFPYSFD